MKNLTSIAALFLVLSLAACGGGADHAPHVGPVTVALLGDSTQEGEDGYAASGLVVHTPAVELQSDMDTRFGPGVVVVTTYAKGGTVATQAPHVVADVIVTNFGINDMRLGVTLEAYKAAMIATGATLIETQNPIANRAWPEASFVAAAKSLGLPVADVNAYVLGLTDWPLMEGPLGVHPSDALYVQIVDNVLAPAVAEQVQEILR